MPKLVYTNATFSHFFTQFMSALASCIKSHWKEQDFHRSLHQMTCAYLGGQSSDVCLLISPFCLLWPDQCWPTELQATVDPVSTTYWDFSVHGSIAMIAPLWDWGLGPQVGIVHDADHWQKVIWRPVVKMRSWWGERRENVLPAVLV